MKVLLFDVGSGGHHRIYIERMIEVLADHAQVTVAAPGPSIEGPQGVDTIDTKLYMRVRAGYLERMSGRLAAQGQALHELRALDRAEAECRPDFSVHLFADHLLPFLVLRRPRGVPRALLLFRPRRHYGDVFGTRLGPTARSVAALYELLVRLWRRREDAHAVLTLDDEAARLWQQEKGAPAYWLPEPPVAHAPQVADPSERSGALLFGALTPRKGLDLLADALSSSGNQVPVTIAGNIVDGAEIYVSQQVSALRENGVAVELRARHHSEEEALNLMSSARCAVIPYVNHFGMSRVLLEACVTGTPVVAHSGGLLGHLVRTYGIGVAADATHPREFGEALVSLYTNTYQWEKASEAATSFAERYSEDVFRQALLGCLGIGPVRAVSADKVNSG